MKTCEKCGTTNEADVRFCISCGAEFGHDESISSDDQSGLQDAGQKDAHQSNVCGKCGTKNEAGTKFCVACGHNLSAGVTSAQNVQVADEALAQLRNVPNPLLLAWNGFLYPERMIVVGALGASVVAFYRLFGSGFIAHNLFYFAIAIAPLIIIWQSMSSSLERRAEWSGYQIAIGAMLATNPLFTIINVFGYRVTSYIFGYWLSFLFAVSVLAGAIMLQNMLLRHFFSGAKK